MRPRHKLEISELGEEIDKKYHAEISRLSENRKILQLMFKEILFLHSELRYEIFYQHDIQVHESTNIYLYGAFLPV